jgi:hypothetical protein
MIVFGWGKNCKEIGKGLIQECPNCKNIKQWVIVQTSKKASLYFVPVAKWNKQYFCACPVCNNGVKLESLEDAHKIMEAAIRQEAELKKQFFNKQIDSSPNHSYFPKEEKSVPKGKIFIENGFWECKDCHIKMVDEGDYCSKCRGHKENIGIRGEQMEGLSVSDEKIIKVFKELTYLSGDFQSDMMKVYPNVKNVDAQVAKYCPMMVFYLLFFDVIRADGVPQAKVEEISGMIEATLAHLNPNFIELIDDCQKFVRELIQNYTKKEKKEPETIFFVYSYGNWIYYRFFLKPPTEKGEDIQAVKFGDYIIKKVMTYWSEQKGSLLPF